MNVKTGFAVLLLLALLAGCAAPPAATEAPATAQPAPTQPTAPPDTAPQLSSMQIPPPETQSLPELPAEMHTITLPNDMQTQRQTPQTPEGYFRFDFSNFPRLDGSASLKPLGEAVASVMLGERREAVQEKLRFSQTTRAYELLIEGYSDLLLVSEPNQSVFTKAQSEGVALDMAQIAIDGLVFVVNKDNPVESLSVAQLRDIYAGKITNWKQVGGSDVQIVPFRRGEASGSQMLMDQLVMDGQQMADAPVEYLVVDMDEVVERVRGYDNSVNAIGYSAYHYAHEMETAAELKLLKIDGVAPNRETIRSGEYPLLSPCYCVIRQKTGADSPTRMLYEWLQSEQGQSLVEHEGYIPATGRN